MNTPKDWGITSNYFDDNNIGKAKKMLKFPKSIIINFRKTITNATGQDEEVFDYDAVVENLAQMVISSIVAQKEILRRIKMEWILPKDADCLRRCVGLAIEHLVENRQFWERVNQSQIGLAGYNISNDRTNWLLNANMIGMKAWNELINSEIDQYEIIDEYKFELSMRDKYGNITILGKYDLDKVPELI